MLLCRLVTTLSTVTGVKISPPKAAIEINAISGALRRKFHILLLRPYNLYVGRSNAVV